MNISSNFHDRIRAGERVAGTFLNLGSPLAVELAGCSGFDWVLIDLEHGAGGEDTLLHLLHAAGTTPAFPIVRIAANETPRFKRTLDLGPGGIMVPWINTAEEARAAVTAMRYPPRGVRGVTKLTRACAFGAGFPEYYARSHEHLVLMAQIETVEAVQNVDEIAAIDGVHVLFIGPMDLTTSLGIQEQYDHPAFLSAVDSICAAARRHRKAVGILLLNPSLLPLCTTYGITVIALGSDGGILMAGFRANAAAIRATPGGSAAEDRSSVRSESR